MISADTRQFATFFVDELCMGIDVRDVREILHGYQLTRVPLAAPTIAGLINLRGEIVTAFDMRRILGRSREQSDVQAGHAHDQGHRPPHHDNAQNSQRVTTALVVQPDGRPLSLLVDTVGEVIDVSAELFEPPPDTLQGTARELILGAYKLQTRLLLALDVRRATDTRR